MTLFKTRASRIFKDASWLQPLSNPPGGKPLCRDADLEDMAFLLTNIFKVGQARNLFIFGKPGTGKTACVHYLLKEMQKHADESGIPFVAVYVNAGKTRTPYYTMLEIVRSLRPSIPDRGWQMYRLKQAFEEARTDHAVIIAIDEVDAIIFKEKEPLVYYLNRQSKTTLILLSNTIEDATTLPNRALSTLQPQLIRLEPYTPDEAKTILAERVKNALQPDTVSENLLNIIAETTALAEDIRLGFAILLSAGLFAEDSGRNRIEATDIESAVDNETRLQRIKGLMTKIKSLKKRLKNAKD